MASAFITASVVAELIGLPDAHAFYSHRLRLTTDHAFPLPMPTSFRPLRWRRDEVEAWVARQGVPAAPRLVIPHGANITLLNHARTA